MNYSFNTWKEIFWTRWRIFTFSIDSFVEPYFIRFLVDHITSSFDCIASLPICVYRSELALVHLTLFFEAAIAKAHIANVVQILSAGIRHDNSEGVVAQKKVSDQNHT